MVCFSVLACYLAVSLDFTIRVNCYSGNSSESPKMKGQGGSSHLCLLPCSLRVWAVWGRPGWRAGFPPRAITAPSTCPDPCTLPSFGCCSWGQRREGRLCEQGCARHGAEHGATYAASSPALWPHLAPECLCFQALAWACPALFRLRNSHSARVSEGPEFLCACSSFARSCSTNDFYHMCISISEDHILVLS